MLQLERLRLSHGTFQLSADLTVPSALKVAVIGPSGAGKSTLLAAIAGFLRPAAGRIVWRGENLTAMGPDRRPVSMLFQDNNLFPHLTVAQNVALGIKARLRLDQREQNQRDAALERVGLKAFADQLPGNLSGGQQSRAALARVLVQNRPLILLDEPFAALGPALRTEMLALVGALAEETRATLLLVTHAPQEAVRVADDMIFVDAGEALPPQPAADLMNNPPAALRAYLG